MPLSLNTLAADRFRLTPPQRAALRRLGIVTVKDLLYHFPVRYGDAVAARSIETLRKGDTAVVFGKITGLKASKGFKTKITMADGVVEDETGKIHCVWFNQPYLAKMTPEGAFVRVEGKVSQRRSKRSAPGGDNSVPGGAAILPPGRAAPVGTLLSPKGEASSDGTLLSPKGREDGSLYFSNPKIEIVNNLPIGVGDSLFDNEGAAHNLYPVYPESRGVSSVWLYHNIQKIFKTGILDELEDPLPGHILVKYHLPNIRTALVWIHAPMKPEDAEAARKRFAFEEIFLIQLSRQKARAEYRANLAFIVEPSKKSADEFVKRFPFPLTGAQSRAIEAILSDFAREQAMGRLLEGDVGSGKTAVAAAAAFAAVTTRPSIVNKLGERVQQKFGNLQVAYMCPTEILATQQFESFIQYFSYLPIRIGLITGSGCRVFPSKVNPKGWTDIARNQLLQWVGNGEIAVLIGTHALIQKSVVWKHLAFVIIDEQHRFGTAQRAKLLKKNLVIPASRSEAKAQAGIQGQTTKTLDPRFRGDNKKSGDDTGFRTLGATAPAGGNSVPGGAAILPTGRAAPVGTLLSPKGRALNGHVSSALTPHLLSMTATPIPRTLALTLYGDLDLTLLDESPAGRKPIVTEIVYPTKRLETYEKIRQELAAGRQMFVICPRIDEPDPDKEASIIAKSVKEEAKRLQKDIFPEYEVGVLHGKMKPAEKDRVMEDFKDGKLRILCSTSVVEVGMNVPNATVIVIEGAERFGLAQLHQLRGRVMRSSFQAYCYCFAETTGEKSVGRLKALKTARNGFELAESDLEQRGAGELSGARQWGVSDIAMDALRNLRLVEAARAEAVRLIAEDAGLSRYPALRASVREAEAEMHFE